MYTLKKVEEVLEPTLMAYRLAGHKIDCRQRRGELIIYIVLSSPARSSAIGGRIRIHCHNKNIQLDYSRCFATFEGTEFDSCHTSYNTVPSGFVKAMEYIQKDLV